MYAVMIHQDHQLPKVVSTYSRDYAELLLAGYTEVFKGSQSDCNEKEEEMLTEIYIDYQRQK